MWKLVLTLLLVGCVGCPRRGNERARKLSVADAPPVTVEAKQAAARPQSPQVKSREPFASVPRIARGNFPTAIHVDIYQLSVPYGTVSRNERFWKRIDEQCVDVRTYDTLFKNGIRVGQAPTEEWDYFKNIMEDHPAVTRINSLVSLEGKTIELPVRKQIPRQDIFYFDRVGELRGRTFDSSENLITMVLQPAPRKLDTVRITLCPVVRATRKKLEYSTRNKEEGEFTYVAPEQLYDLNLRVDVPLDSFFVIAPSGEATWSTSVGNHFFIHPGAADQLETVMLVVPRIVKMEIRPPTQNR